MTLDENQQIISKANQLGVFHPAGVLRPAGKPRRAFAMNARLGKLEGEISGLKHSQMMILTGIGVVAALTLFVGGLVLWQFTKLDQTNDRIDKLTERVIELPSRVSAELRDIARTLAAGITAEVPDNRLPVTGDEDG